MLPPGASLDTPHLPGFPSVPTKAKQGCSTQARICFGTLSLSWMPGFSLPLCHFKGTHIRGAVPPSGGGQGAVPTHQPCPLRWDRGVPRPLSPPQAEEGRGAIGTDSRMAPLALRMRSN